MRNYIVIASGGIGGAEKRFFDLFYEMRKRDKNVFLVIPSCLYSLLDISSDEGVVVIELEKWSILKFYYFLYRSIIYLSDRNDTFHYPLNPPFFLHFFPHRKYSISFCYCYKSPRLLIKNKALILQYLASFFSSSIDVLNQSVLDDFMSNNPRLKDKLKLTPGGTFLSSKHQELKNKKKSIVFLSRLEEGKGINVLFQVIPMMHEFFCNNGCDDFIFDIYGKGSLEASVIRHVENLYRKGIKINYHGYIDSSTVFPNALAVLSLQTYTNYPSRVVAEALVCGCEAIILDSGDSKNFGNQLGIHYLNENLNNISEISMQILSSDQKKQEEISRTASERFCSYDYILYYKKIFTSL